MYKAFTVKELLALDGDEIGSWIVPNMIPAQSRVFVYGVGGEYKTTVLLDLCIAISSGGKMLEQFPVVQFGPTLLLSVESNLIQNRSRILAHLRSRNLHPEAVQLHYGQNRVHINTKEGRAELEERIALIKPRMIVFDPYVKFLNGDENSTKDATEFTNVLDDFIEKYKLTVVVIHHASKKDEIRGSSVIQGWCDAIIRFKSSRNVTLAGMPAPVRIVTAEAEKMRNGQEGKLFSAVPFHKEDQMIDWGIITDADKGDVIIAFLKQELFEYLRRPDVHVMTATALAEAFRVGKDKIDRALEWLERDGFIEAVVAQRSTGGGRTRSVVGWRSNSRLGGFSRVDVSRAMLDVVRREMSAEEMYRETDDDQQEIDS